MEHRAATLGDGPQITSEQKAEVLRRMNRRRTFPGLVWEWAKTFVIAVGLFLVVRAFLFEAFKIPSGSMENTLLVGDFLFVNKATYGAQIPFTHFRLPALQQPQRGDVVVFIYPVDGKTNFVKRLVGVPGDTLEMRDGVLVRNGVPLRESYVTHSDPDVDPSNEEFRWQRPYLVSTAEARASHPSRNNWGPLIVPQRNYFVLGDNRDNSLDSRYWGFVPDSLLKGRPLVVYYSYSPDTAARFAWLSRIRWERIGERIH